MYQKSQKLTFSPVKLAGSTPVKNDKYMKNPYKPPEIKPATPPDISKTELENQVPLNFNLDDTHTISKYSEF